MVASSHPPECQCFGANFVGNHGRPASLTSASGFTTRDIEMNGSKEQRCEVDVPGIIPFVWTCDHLGRQIAF